MTELRPAEVRVPVQRLSRFEEIVAPAFRRDDGLPGRVDRGVEVMRARPARPSGPATWPATRG